MELDVDPKKLCCQLCHQTGLKKFEVSGVSEFLVCESCELFQYGRVAEASEYGAAYHTGYSRHRERKIRTARVRLNRAAGLLASSPACAGNASGHESNPNISLLDVGCSVGATLEAAKQFGWNSCGVDVSEEAVAYCREQGLNATRVSGLKLPFEDNRFDLVVNWHVIEHVEDVRETLNEWKRVLKPGGLLFMETPDAASPKVRRLGNRYRKFWAPEHTYTFTYRNLSGFLTETGFEVVGGPWIGPLANHGFSFAPYAIGNRVYQAIRKMAGIHKEFQIFARKNLENQVPLADLLPAAA